MPSSARSSPDLDAIRQPEGRKAAHDRFSVRLVLGRQLEMGAEIGVGLVDQESGRIGRHLEQHSARLAEVDRPEVVAIHDR